MINDKVYDILNIIAKIIAPIATFISAILVIWKIPYSQQITATMAAFDVLIGALVTIFKAVYNKQKIEKQ